MIKMTSRFSVAALQGLQAYMQDFDNVAYQVFEDVAHPIGQAAVQTLSIPAGTVRYPIQWASEAQRRAFFATKGFGRGIPARRTGATLKAWKYSIKRDQSGFTFSIFNTKPWAKYLFGSLAQNERSAARFQQPMHRNTGYPLASPIVKSRVDMLRDNYAEEMRRIAVVEFKRRAFTKGTRKR